MWYNIYRNKKMWKPKTVATIQIVTMTWDYLISIIVSQSVAADGSLFIDNR